MSDTAKQAVRRNIPEINVSDIGAMPMPDITPSDIILVGFSPSAPAGNQFVAFPSSAVAGLGGGDIPDILAIALGQANVLRGQNSFSVGTVNYQGGKRYNATLVAGSTTLSLVGYGDLTDRVYFTDFISITSQTTGKTVERQIVAPPTYGGGIFEIEIDSPIDTESTTVLFTQTQYGQNTLTVGSLNEVAGNRSASIGSGHEITQFAPDSLAVGIGHYINHYASMASGAYAKSRYMTGRTISGKQITTKGDCQSTEVVIGGVTTNATPTEIFQYDGVSRLVIPGNTVVRYRVEVIATQTATAGGGTVGDSFAQEIFGAIKNIGGTVSGVAQTASTAQKDAAFGGTVAITADNTDKCLKVVVTGEANKPIKWVAKVTLVETAF